MLDPKEALKDLGFTMDLGAGRICCSKLDVWRVQVFWFVGHRLRGAGAAQVE